MTSALLSFVLIIGGYLIGSVCSAVIVCRLFDLPDPTAEGSKNPGATNVLRLAGKKYAIMVLVSDMLKGTLPVLFAKLIGVPLTSLGMIALAAVIGHIYPLYFGFKGGKGVATALGGFLGLNVFFGLFILALWVLVAKQYKYSSLASIVSLCAAPLVAPFFMHGRMIILPLFLISGLVIYQHQENIKRLRDKTESKINLDKK
jgi:glycerol-3-phosphate acyltransferase PlsY